MSENQADQKVIESTITEETNEGPIYAGYPAIDLAQKGYGIVHVVFLLWFRRLATTVEAKIINRIIILSADHGPSVSGALVTIIAACARIPLAQSLAAGLMMIGPKFGGAVDPAGKYWEMGVEKFRSPIKKLPQASKFLKWIKKNVGKMPGLGHRMFSKSNPDPRVKDLVEYVKSLGIETPHLDFALAVQKEALKKRDNLVLNVDGCIAAILLDLKIPAYTLNAFFILARTIGFMGHWIDQRRMQVESGGKKAGLVRLFGNLVKKRFVPKKEVPELKKAA